MLQRITVSACLTLFSAAMPGWCAPLTSFQLSATFSTDGTTLMTFSAVGQNGFTFYGGANTPNQVWLPQVPLAGVACPSFCPYFDISGSFESLPVYRPGGNSTYFFAGYNGLAYSNTSGDAHHSFGSAQLHFVSTAVSGTQVSADQVRYDAPFQLTGFVSLYELGQNIAIPFEATGLATVRSELLRDNSGAIIGSRVGFSLVDIPEASTLGLVLFAAGTLVVIGKVHRR